MNPFESDINASILMNPYSVVAFNVHDRNVPFHSIEIPPPPKNEKLVRTWHFEFRVLKNIPSSYEKLVRIWQAF